MKKCKHEKLKDLGGSMKCISCGVRLLGMFAPLDKDGKFYKQIKGEKYVS